MKLISLSKGMHAQVSDNDYDFLMQWKWSVSRESRDTKWYAIRWSRKSEHGNGRRYKIRMHRVVAGLLPMTLSDIADGVVVNHIDDNGLNNQRENLEICSQNENMNKVSNWNGSTAYKNDQKIDGVTEIVNKN